jgi:hypothetical protein
VDRKGACREGCFAARVLRQVKKGSIVLLHDAPLTAQALPSIIDGLKRRGFKFGSASEFLREETNRRSLAATPGSTWNLTADR